MKLTRTAKIKINMLAEEILPTIKAYTKAFNYVCQIGYTLLYEQRSYLQATILVLVVIDELHLL